MFTRSPDLAIDVSSLVSGTNQWENIPEVVRSAFRELLSAFQTDRSDINSIKATMRQPARPCGGSPDKTCLDTLQSGLRDRDVLLTSLSHDVAMLAVEVDGMKGFVERRLSEGIHAAHKSTVPSDVSTQLSSLRQDVQRIEDASRRELREIHAKIDSMYLPSSHHYPTVDTAALTANLDVLRDMLSKKADVDAVADALDLKANKASVASALHSKLSKDKAADRFSKMEAGIEAIHSQIAVLRSVSTSQPPPTIVKEITHAPDASRLQDMEAALSRLRSEMNDVRNRLDRCEASPVEGRRLFVTHAEFDAAQRDLATRSELTSTIKALKASVKPQLPPSPSPPGVTLAEFSGLRDEVTRLKSVFSVMEADCTNKLAKMERHMQSSDESWKRPISELQSSLRSCESKLDKLGDDVQRYRSHHGSKRDVSKVVSTPHQPDVTSQVHRIEDRIRSEMHDIHSKLRQMDGDCTLNKQSIAELRNDVALCVKACQDETQKLHTEVRRWELVTSDTNQRLEAKVTSLHNQHAEALQESARIAGEVSSLARKTSQYEATLETVHASLSAIKSAVKSSAKVKPVVTVAESVPPRRPVNVTDDVSSIDSFSDSPRLVSRYPLSFIPRPIVPAVSPPPATETPSLSLQSQLQSVHIEPVIHVPLVSSQQQTDAIHRDVVPRSSQSSPAVAPTATSGQQTDHQSKTDADIQTDSAHVRGAASFPTTARRASQDTHRAPTAPVTSQTIGVQTHVPTDDKLASSSPPATSDRHTHCAVESGSTSIRHTSPQHRVKVTIERQPSAASATRSQSVTHHHQHSHRPVSAVQPSVLTSAVHRPSVWYTTPCSSCDRGYVESMSTQEEDRIRQRVRDDVITQTKLRRK